MSCKNGELCSKKLYYYKSHLSLNLVKCHVLENSFMSVKKVKRGVVLYTSEVLERMACQEASKRGRSGLLTKKKSKPLYWRIFLPETIEIFLRI